MSKAECRICRYVYNPKRNDPRDKIKPSPEMEFDDLPENWICPSCGTGKDAFYKLE